MVAPATLKTKPSSRRTAKSAAAWGALVTVVAAVHGCVVHAVGWQLAALKASPDDMPERLEVRYVREMAVAPAVTAPAVAAAPPRRAAPRALPAAQGRPPPDDVGGPAANTPPPVEAAASATPLPDVAGQADVPPSAASDPIAAAAASAVVAASTESPASAASAPSPSPATTSTASAPPAGGAAQEPAPQAVDSVWPQSTRVRYTASGYYQGEISGNASVEWVRRGNRYQMHMDVRMGFLFQRRATSQGRIEAQGVVPERYDESTKVPFRSERRVTLRFDDQAVELSEGQRLPRPAGVQDTTSQFVQLTYLFTTQPGLLRAGQSIEFPLAFPRRIRAYSYLVQEMETLHTPFGPLQALHVKPRRVEAKERDLVAQAWFAPQLHYLPVRIRIEQGEDTYIDLMIDKRPELAQ